MTLSQNASTLLQNLQLKNKKGLLNIKSQAITAQQTRKLKIMANLTSKDTKQSQQATDFEQGNLTASHAQKQNFRLFTTAVK